MPFYFNEIQATTSNMVDIGNNDKLIYGVFTTPDNAIAGSAICSFKLSDILHSFDGPFKGQSSQNANWLPIWNTPSPRPGSCNAGSEAFTERNLNFIKTHPLMDEAVMQSGSKPVLVQTGFHEKFTVIAVDPQVPTPYGESYDILFVGTTRGQVLKIITAKSEPVIIEDIQVFPHSVAVTNVQVVRDQSQDVDLLVVLSDHEVKSLPLNRCTASVLQNCGSCVALRDPYCAWNLLTNSCVDHRVVNDSDGSAFLQSIDKGKHEGCVAAAEQGKLIRFYLSMIMTYPKFGELLLLY